MAMATLLAFVFSYMYGYTAYKCLYHMVMAILVNITWKWLQAYRKQEVTSYGYVTQNLVGDHAAMVPQSKPLVMLSGTSLHPVDDLVCLWLHCTQ
jgi:hypothetical protein